MISRRTPHNVLGINQQQTSNGATASRSLPSTSVSTNILQLHNGLMPQKQAVNIKLTDDCYQNIQKAAQNGYEVLVHINQKSITIEIKTHNSPSLKFECYFERVSGNLTHALCKSKSSSSSSKNNIFYDVANINIRAQVKPTEQTFQSSRLKAANLSKHLEMESNKCRTQMIASPIIKPGEKSSFKNKPIINRIGTIPKSNPPPPPSQNSRNNGSSSSNLRTSNSSSSLSSLAAAGTNNKVSGPGIPQPRGPNDYALKQQVIHYIACGRFKTQDEIVDHIMSTGLPSGIVPESAKRKIREVICEVAEVYVNPPKIALLPKYYREINIDWEGYSTEDRERVRQALSETDLKAGNCFAPMRSSKRGPLVAPRSKPRKDPATPSMTNSTTTSPDIASDASTCSTPSPQNTMQTESEYNLPKIVEKRKLNGLTPDTRATIKSIMTSFNSPLNINNDECDAPLAKKRLITPDKSNTNIQPIGRESSVNSLSIPVAPSIPKSSSQSDFQKIRGSPYSNSNSFASPKPQQQQNGFKSGERSDSISKNNYQRSKDRIETIVKEEKNQLYNGFMKASKVEDKMPINGIHISKKNHIVDSPKPTKFSSNHESLTAKSEANLKLKVKSEPTTIEADTKSTIESEKTKALVLKLDDETMKKMKEKREKKKEKHQKREKLKNEEDHRKMMEEKASKWEAIEEKNIVIKREGDNAEKLLQKSEKLEIVQNVQKVEDGISTVEKKPQKLDKHQPKEKSEKHRNKEKLKEEEKPKIEKLKISTLKENSSFKESQTPSISIKMVKENFVKESSSSSSQRDDVTKSKEKSKDRHHRHHDRSSSSSSSNKMPLLEKEIKNEAKTELINNGISITNEKQPKKEKNDKEHKKEKHRHRSHKHSESESIKVLAEKERKVQNGFMPSSQISSKVTENFNKVAVKPKEEEKVTEKEKRKDKEKTKEREKDKSKEKSSKHKTHAQKTPSKEPVIASKASVPPTPDKFLLAPAEKLSKPVPREAKMVPPTTKEMKPLNPEKSTAEELQKINIQDLLKLLSDPLKPSKNYEDKYPPIRNQAEAQVCSKHELTYYELYEKAYNKLLKVQNDLSLYIERMNKAKTSKEREELEQKIRTYAARCLQDSEFAEQRQTVSNMTKAIQVLRQRLDDYYGPEEK